MKIDYRETTNDLLKRIDIHSQYGAKNIDEWMLDIIKLEKGIENTGCWLWCWQAMLFIPPVPGWRS